jgi:hypothetical protein
MRWLACCGLLALSSIGGGPTSGATPPGQTGSADPLWSTVLQVLGVSANPSSLKGEEELTSGQIWRVGVQGGGRQRISAEAGYRSPVLIPGGPDVLALRGEDLVRLAPPSWQAKKVATLPGAAKLVGFDRKDANRVLLLRDESGGRVSVWWLSVATGVLTVVPQDPDSARDHAMIEHLQGWQRSYDGTQLYVQRVSGSSISGPVEWSDVFVKTPGHEPIDVSDCKPVDCGQPALSADGGWVVYIHSVP